jgi:glycosyltransferase involved in cell wall biosynthesis
MNLLMITRKVDKNDALAGFTYGWVKEMARNLDKLYVITWQKSDSSGLPDNVEVISLSGSKWKKFFVIKWKALKLLSKVDGVFCHMNPEYTILVGPCARLRGKRVVSWYTHRSVTIRRRILELLAHRIVTASNKSFRNPWFVKKVEAIGHGINTDFFKPNDQIEKRDGFNIVSVGRISPTKDYESIIKAVDELDDKRINFKIIGDVILNHQKKYLETLKMVAKAMKIDDQVEFTGWVANSEMVPYYQEADLFINMSGTGSVDKVVLEAMASGCIVLTSNEAFAKIIPSELMVEKDNPSALAKKIKWVMELSIEDKKDYVSRLREIVVKSHNLPNLAKKLIKQFDA